MRNRSDGFTLVELMVAVVLGTTAALLATATFAQVEQGVLQVTRAAEIATSHANLRAWLSEVFAWAQPPLPGDPFEGSATAVSLTTFLWDSGGGRQQHRATITMNGDTLTLSTAAGRYRLASGIASAEFDYLGSYGSRASYTRLWDSKTSLPFVVRLRLGREESRPTIVDTLVFWIGARP